MPASTPSVNLFLFIPLPFLRFVIPVAWETPGLPTMVANKSRVPCVKNCGSGFLLVKML